MMKNRFCAFATFPFLHNWIEAILDATVGLSIDFMFCARFHNQQSSLFFNDHTSRKPSNKRTESRNIPFANEK